MTGVEAVSNGVKAFREPVVSTARRTLTVIILLLMVLLAGVAYLVRVYGIQATDPGQPGYQSVLSLLLAAVSGRGVFYYVSMASILLVLALDRKSTRLNSSHGYISYAVFCLKKKTKVETTSDRPAGRRGSRRGPVGIRCLFVQLLLGSLVTVLDRVRGCVKAATSVASIVLAL